MSAKAVDSPLREVPRLTADGISVRIGEKPILDDVSVSLPPGSMTALLGPNGAGKTTLIRTLAGVIRPTSGQVLLGTGRMADLNRRAAARICAYLPQGAGAAFEIRVRQAVLMGRYPHVGMLGRMSADDFRAVDWAMARVGIADLADRTLTSLSGGERQRVFVARALAQQAPILLLDEPTSSLDIGRQLDLLELLVALNREGRTVLAAIHDLRPAGEFFPQAVLLDGGRLADSGPTDRVLAGKPLADAFGVFVTRGEEFRFARGAARP